MPKNRDRLLRALFQEAPEGIVIADKERRIVDINAAFTALLGYTLDEIEGQPTSVLYADTLDFETTGQSVFSEKGPSTPDENVLYQRYKRRDGSILNARTLAIRLLDEAGEVHGFAGRIHDLDALLPDAEKSVSRLEAERALLEALYRKTPAMLFSADQNGRIENISDALAVRLGMSGADALGHLWTEFLMEPDRNEAARLMDQVVSNGICKRAPYRFCGKNGSLVECELSAIVNATKGRQNLLVILDDVTARNRAQKRLESRSDEIRQFARIAAHDLRTPLRHISLFAEEVNRAVTAAGLSDVADDVNVIRESANRLASMVQSLLEFSVASDHSITPGRVDLGQVMERVLQTHADDIAASEAKMEIAELPVITCDAVLIERVFDNLLANALKYVAPKTRPHIQVTAQKLPASWVLEVQDNGIGISPAFRRRIFDPLTRLHSPDSFYPGNGIGLSLAQRIVEAHGGKIWVDAGEDGGSVFHVELPSHL